MSQNDPAPEPATKVPTPDEQPLLDVWPDAAEVFDLGRTVAYRMAREGSFPVEVLQIGGRFKVRTADVRRYLGLDIAPAH